MLGTTKTHVAATELTRSCLAVDVADRVAVVIEVILISELKVAKV
jgi:hypothetical protein